MDLTINAPKEVESLIFRFEDEIVVVFKDHKGCTVTRTYFNTQTRFSYDEENQFVKEGLYTYKEEQKGGGIFD